MVKDWTKIGQKWVKMSQNESKFNLIIGQKNQFELIPIKIYNM